MVKDVTGEARNVLGAGGGGQNFCMGLQENAGLPQADVMSQGNIRVSTLTAFIAGDQDKYIKYSREY